MFKIKQKAQQLLLPTLFKERNKTQQHYNSTMTNPALKYPSSSSGWTRFCSLTHTCGLSVLQHLPEVRSGRQVPHLREVLSQIHQGRDVGSSWGWGPLILGCPGCCAVAGAAPVAGKQSFTHPPWAAVLIEQIKLATNWLIGEGLCKAARSKLSRNERSAHL